MKLGEINMKLIIKNMQKNFGPKEVLKNINFEFSAGKIYGLLGRNGAGKTTFFNCLNEDLNIDNGEFYLKEKNAVNKITPNDIGYVLSTPNVPEFLTGREFLEFFLEINNFSKSLKSPDEYFDFIKIPTPERDKLLRDYSLGMQNKMQMLIHLISEPKILLLDEPLTSFDVIVSEEMKETLRDFKKEHIVIFSTHIMELALDLCDEIVILKDGNLKKISKDDLDNKSFKTKIIESLKEE